MSSSSIVTPNPSSAARTRPATTDSTTTHDAYRRIAGGIEGWFFDGAIAVWDSLLAWQQRRRIGGNLLEIGVHHGKSAALMAMHAEPGQKVVLVDYELKPGPIEQALQAAQPAPGVEFVTVHGDSRDLPTSPLANATRRSYRWIHIDGEHTGGAVSSDLATANQLLAKNGVVVVDDFFSWLYPQVTESVLRHVREHPDDLALFLCGFNKAYLARPHFVHEYLRFCAEELPNALAARGQQATVGKTTFPAEMNTFGVGPRFQDKALRGPDWDDSTIRY